MEESLRFLHPDSIDGPEQSTMSQLYRGKVPLESLAADKAPLKEKVEAVEHLEYVTTRSLTKL